eukprot:m51a1_g8300 hypothetical protein (362) ;mRNA; f:38907-39992
MSASLHCEANLRRLLRSCEDTLARCAPDPRALAAARPALRSHVRALREFHAQFCAATGRLRDAEASEYLRRVEAVSSAVDPRGPDAPAAARETERDQLLGAREPATSRRQFLEKRTSREGKSAESAESAGEDPEIATLEAAQHLAEMTALLRHRTTEISSAITGSTGTLTAIDSVVTGNADGVRRSATRLRGATSSGWSWRVMLSRALAVAVVVVLFLMAYAVIRVLPRRHAAPPVAVVPSAAAPSVQVACGRGAGDCATPGPSVALRESAGPSGGGDQWGDERGEHTEDAGEAGGQQGSGEHSTESADSDGQRAGHGAARKDEARGGAAGSQRGEPQGKEAAATAAASAADREAAQQKEL